MNWDLRTNRSAVERLYLDGFAAAQRSGGRCRINAASCDRCTPLAVPASRNWLAAWRGLGGTRNSAATRFTTFSIRTAGARATKIPSATAPRILRMAAGNFGMPRAFRLRARCRSPHATFPDARQRLRFFSLETPQTLGRPAAPRTSRAQTRIVKSALGLSRAGRLKVR